MRRNPTLVFVAFVLTVFVMACMTEEIGDTPPSESRIAPTTSAAPESRATAASFSASAMPTSTQAEPRQSTPNAASPAVTPIVETWTVVHIVDGDTVDMVSSSGVQERVRMIGIDTPERGECGFDEAADALARLVADRPVTLVPGARDDRDRYDRLLRYLDVGTVDAGLELVRAGHAIARYDSRDGYGRHPREETYVAADAAALGVCDAPMTATATPAEPTSAPGNALIQVFQNCSELNAVYPGGVARVGVTGNSVSGSLRPFGTTPHFDEALYGANRARDGDKDGIACER